MTTGKIYLSRDYFCFIPLHLLYAEINGSLLYFMRDVCVGMHICVCT